MEDVRAASGAAQNADGFCSYLVENLFAFWRANGALIFRVQSNHSLKPIAAAGWLTTPDNQVRFTAMAEEHMLKQLANRSQLLYADLAGRGHQIDVDFLGPNCDALLMVGNHPGTKFAGGVVVTFRGTLATEEVEQIRRTFPMLKASLNLFLGSDSEPEWAKRYPLSQRQVAILKQIIEGVSYRDISKGLWVSESTIKQEAKRIFNALSVKNRYEAAKLLAKEA